MASVHAKAVRVSSNAQSEIALLTRAGEIITAPWTEIIEAGVLPVGFRNASVLE